MGDDCIVALDRVSFTVDRGEMVAVIGGSDSGKSTLLNILGCLEPPTHGCYRLAGNDVATLSDNERSALRSLEIGFVFQSFQLLARATALTNIALPLIYRGVGSSARKSAARTMLARLGLEKRMHHRPNQLSGGQRQRVAIARALVGKPSLLLADEPTGNLDSTTRQEIIALFRDLHRDGNTIVLVTHEPAIAAECPRVIRLRDGKIIADGSAKAVTVATARSERGAQ